MRKNITFKKYTQGDDLLERSKDQASSVIFTILQDSQSFFVVVVVVIMAVVEAVAV